jgi:AcrR family transcriptional regulator
MGSPSLPWIAAPKPARRRLGVDAIVNAGLQILAAEGIDAVTMRAVAAKLNTGAASLYAHVADKSQLHVLLLDAVIGEVVIEEADPARWQEQLKDACRSLYATLNRHPGIALINIAHIPTGPNALRSAEAMLKIVLAGGLSPDAAGLAIDLVTLYPTAVAVEESIWQDRARAHPDGGESEASVVAQVDSYFRSLPPELFPVITAMAPYLTGPSGELRFEFGLGVLVAGLDAMKNWKPPQP